MLHLTTFNRRKNRWIVTRPESPEDQQKTVLAALALGWTQKELAEDWGVSAPRIHEIKRIAERKHKVLAGLIKDAGL